MRWLVNGDWNQKTSLTDCKPIQCNKAKNLRKLKELHLNGIISLMRMKALLD